MLVKGSMYTVVVGGGGSSQVLFIICFLNLAVLDFFL